jgi:hypothetical protein
MGAAAIVLIREKRVMQNFLQAGATSPDRAVTPEELGVDTGSISWRRLRDHAIVREAGVGTGRFYLDVEVRDAVHGMRLRFLMVMILLLVVALAFGIIASVAS